MRARYASALALLLCECTRVHAVPVTLAVPVETTATTYELWVLEAGAVCPEVEELAAGGPATALVHQIFASGEGVAIGRLEVDQATFVAIGRGDECRVELFGCETLAFRDEGIRLHLTATTAPAPACGLFRSCADGRCVNGLDAGTDGPMYDAGPPDAGTDAGPPPPCPPPVTTSGAPAGLPSFTAHGAGSGLEGYAMLTMGDTSRRANDVELRDLDQDGDLDVTIVDRRGWWPYGEGTTRVYRTDPGPVFTDVSEAVFAGFPLRTTGTFGEAQTGLWVDLDGDGRLDAFGGSYGTAGALYRDAMATGMPALEYLPLFPGARSELQIESAAFGDLDGDGDLDMVAAHWNGEARVFLGDGGSGAGWTDATATWLASVPLRHGWYRPILADFDDDGDLDLLTQVELDDRTPPDAWGGEGILTRYLENGSGAFADRTRAVGAETLFVDGPLAVGDFDDDGDLDIVQIGKPVELVSPDPARHVGAAPYEVRVLRNDRPDFRPFEDVSATAFPSGAPELYTAFRSGEQAVAADVDGDGRLDVLIVRDDRIRLWRNLGAFDGAIRFEEVQSWSSTLPFRRVAVGDLEGDGDVDFAVSEESADHGAQIYESQRGGFGTLRVELRDEGHPNSWGVGARVRVYSVVDEVRSDLVAHRQVIAATDQHTDYAQTFALPADGCYEVEVRWPSGRVEIDRVARQETAQTLGFPRPATP